MATYKIRLKDGRTVKLKGPANASKDQIRQALVKRNLLPGKAATPPAEPADKSFLEKAGEAAINITEKGRKALKPIFEKLKPIEEGIGMAMEQQQKIDPIGSLGMKALGTGLQAFEQGGEAIAEGLAGPGLTAKSVPFLPPPFNLQLAPAQPGEDAIKTSPEVAALIGTGFQMTPDIAAALATPGVMNAFKSVFSKAGAKQAGNFLKQVATRAPKPKVPLVSELEAGLESRISPLRKGIESAEKKILRKESRKQTRIAGLEEARKRAKQAIGSAEKKVGIQIEGTPKGFQKLVKNADKVEKFSDRVRAIIGNKTPQQLAETSSPKSLQKVNKIAQEALKNKSLNDLLRRNLIEVRSKVKAAIDIKAPKVGAARQQLATVEEAIKKTGPELKLEQESARSAKSSLQRQIAEETRAAKPGIKEAKAREAAKKKRSDRIKKAIAIGGGVFLGGKAVKLLELF